MNPDKFTHKTNEGLAAAHELAMSAGHAQFTPLHLAVALISYPAGIFSQAICNVGGEEAAKAAERVFNQALKKLPCQSPPPDEIPASTSLIRAIRRAQAAQKSRGDSHLAVDRLILGLLEDSQIGDLLKEAGVATARVKSELEKLRGKEGKKVESASGDTNFQALKTYGRDLVRIQDRARRYKTESASVSWRSDLSKIDIWYATFGSNMWKPRFLCYIKGGRVDGMQKPCSGSRDKSLPKEILWKTFPHRLFFGRESTRAWGSGGVAFLHPKSKNNDIVHMCLYRITLEQFNDVLLQENVPSYDMTSPLFNLTSLDCIKEKGSFDLEAVKKGWYRNVVYLGMQQDIPILTMTCDMSTIKKFESEEFPLHAPSEAYANTLVRGLVEGRRLSEEEAMSYIKEAATKRL